MASQDSRTDVIFDLKSMLKRFNIDTDKWVGKTFKEKVAYIKKKMKSDDKIDLADCGSKLIDALFRTLHNAAGSRIAQSYITAAETAFDLARINFVCRNAFVAEQYEYRGRFDEMARELGAESDCEITMGELKTSGDMCRFLLNMSSEIQEKHDLRVKKCKNLLKSDDNDDGGYKMRSAVTFTHGDTEYVLLLENYASRKADLGTDHEDYLEGSYTDIRIATLNENYDPDQMDEAIHAIYSAYISQVDLSKYMFDMDNVFFTKFKRTQIGYEPRNIDIERMRRVIDRTLKHNKSRGFLVEGEPGVGKTESIEKVLEGLPEYPVFWVPLEAIGQECIDQTFETISRIDHAIVVFDDIEGVFKGEKDVYSSDFITYLDELREEPSGHIVIIIVNEPQKLHNTLRMRPGRIDEVIVVTAPQNANEIFDVIKQRFVVEKAELPEWATLDNPKFEEICTELARQGITQAYLAGIISDLTTLYEGECTLENFRAVVDSALKSRENSMLVAGSDGRLCTAQTVHPTAPSGPSRG